MNTCAISNCDYGTRQQGMCHTHARRTRLGMDVEAPIIRSAPAETRFWAKVEKTETCWNWTAAKQRGGYGRFGADGFVWQAHRWSYQNFVGPIGDGLEVDHLCFNTSCVNPAHLDAVPRQVNLQRRRHIAARFPGGAS